MTLWNLAILVGYAVGMAAGQVLFKFAADEVRGRDGAFWIALATNRYFLAAATLYAVLSALWVAILMKVPLSTAYPFVVLAFVFTPVLAWWFFGEKLDLTYATGLFFVVVGLGVLISRSQ